MVDYQPVMGQAPGGGGGGGCEDYLQGGAFADLPAAETDGRTYVADDAMMLLFDTGAKWKPWAPLMPFTPPDDSEFSWDNQGTATVNEEGGGVWMTDTAGPHELRVRYKAAPATPYSITGLFLNPFYGWSWPSSGLVFRESGSGKIHKWGEQFSGGIRRSAKWTTAAVFSAQYTGLPTTEDHASRMVWLRITDDGVNRICSWSYDGFHFKVDHTVGRTDFLTADQVGWYMRPGGVLFTQTILFSWRET